MNKRPGHVVVTTEVAMCTFCGRPRTLRSEQHQLGALVRTIVTCETCHRTLSSTIGVAAAETPAAEAPAQERETSSQVEAKPVAVKPAAPAPAKAKAAAKPKAAGAKPKAPANRSRRTG
jgi:hypothetical protein